MKKLIELFIFVLIGAAFAFAQNPKAFFYQSLDWSPDGKDSPSSPENFPPTRFISLMRTVRTL